MPPVTNHRVEQVLALKYAGQTNVAIAQQLGVCVSTVAVLWRRHGHPQRYVQRSAAHIRAVLALHAEGCSNRMIARELGLNSSTVDRWLHSLRRQPHGQSSPLVRSLCRRRHEDAARRHGGVHPSRRAHRQRDQDEARRRGRPEAATGAQADILNRLAQGPATVAELCRDIKRRQIARPLYALLARGLLSRQARSNRPYGGKTYLYRLAATPPDGREL